MSRVNIRSREINILLCEKNSIKAYLDSICKITNQRARIRVIPIKAVLPALIIIIQLQSIRARLLEGKFISYVNKIGD